MRSDAVRLPDAGELRSSAVDLSRYVGLLILLVAIQPLFQAQYQARLVNLVLVQGIAAIGVNIIIGYAGLVSIAHAATMAIGAYASALLMMKLGLPFPVGLAAAALLAAVISGAVGVLGTRIRTNYFLLVTIALSNVVQLVIINEVWLTGGPSGLFNVPAAAIGGFVADTDATFYLLLAPTFVVALYLAERLRGSRTGRGMVAVRIREPAARASGIDARRYRILAMVIGGAYLGVAGSLFGHLIRFLGPESFGVSQSLLLTLAVVVGGIGSNIGAVISISAITFVTQSLQSVGSLWVLLYGLLIIVILVVAPRGLAGLASAGAARLRGRLASAPAGSAGDA